MEGILFIQVVKALDLNVNICCENCQFFQEAGFISQCCVCYSHKSRILAYGNIQSDREGKNRENREFESRISVRTLKLCDIGYDLQA